MSKTEAIQTVEEASLLLVDDEPAVLSITKKLLERRGHRVTACGSGEEALAWLARERFDAMLTDVQMPGINGLSLLRTVRERGLELPVVLVTGNPSPLSAAEAVAQGAFQYMTKPLTSDQLHDVVVRAIASASVS